MTSDVDMIDAPAFLEILEREIEERGGQYAIAGAVEAAGVMTIEAFNRRMHSMRAGEQRRVTFHLVDGILTAIDRHELLDFLVPRRGAALRCEDCEKELTPGDVRVLDLMRVDPHAPRLLYDSTKDKMISRPKNSRRGGRRFRKWTLCRKCAAEELRKRAHHGGTVMVNGKRRSIKSTERLEPKRGGRPGLLGERELRILYRLYERSGISMGELGRRLSARRGNGTADGYTSALRYGWRKLNLPLRPIGEQIGLSLHGTNGTKRKNWKVQCSKRMKNGKRCTNWVRRVQTDQDSKPADDGLCWNHGGREARKEEQDRRVPGVPGKEAAEESAAGTNGHAGANGARAEHAGHDHE